MSREPKAGGQLLFAALDQLGVGAAFGLPGTQLVPLYDALRTSRLRSIVTTHELAATFAAVGYYRASGRPAAVLGIPGPGLGYALAGLAEARQDSAGLLLLTVRPEARGNGPDRQDDPAIAAAAPLVKDVVRITSPDGVPDQVAGAFARATLGEPGPVVLQLTREAVEARTAWAGEVRPPRPCAPREDEVRAIATALARAERPVLALGQGAAGEEAGVRRLAALLGGPVITTGSGRGCLPEDDPLSMAYDPGIRGAGPLAAIVERADAVLVLGAKSAYSGLGGLRLALPPGKSFVVDGSEELGVGGSYAAQVCADVPATIRALVAALGDMPRTPAWSQDEIRALKAECAAAMAEAIGDPPLVAGLEGGVAAFWQDVRRLLPRDACVITDSGLHQMLARAHFTALAPRSLLTPANFQSMGFALPAAVGASLACPGRKVVAVVGDGGVTMSGLELLTAVREEIPLAVLVLNDDGFGLVRRRQLEGEGVDFAVNFAPPDLGLLAASVGAGFSRLGPAGGRLRAAFDAAGVQVVEVALVEPRSTRFRRARNRTVEAVRARVGRGYLTRLRRWLGAAGRG